MPLTRDEVLGAMEQGFQAFLHELRDLQYSLDWKRDFNDSNAWSPRDIVTHLMGALERNTYRALQAIIMDDTPAVQLEGDNPYRSPETRAMTLAQLLDRLVTLEERLEELVSSVSDEQLARKARITGWADGTPLRELTFLEVAHRAFTVHWTEHTKQLYAIREALGVAEL
ncbi:MAG: ClbS/DfsB family four-helix bundle protein [Dehalococcoidia bacterium]|nr:ClbS/DfsB family four-helix bundle protein [Dehalococcoidia bacterium]